MVKVMNITHNYVTPPMRRRGWGWGGVGGVVDKKATHRSLAFICNLFTQPTWFNDILHEMSLGRKESFAANTGGLVSRQVIVRLS